MSKSTDKNNEHDVMGQAAEDGKSQPAKDLGDPKPDKIKQLGSAKAVDTMFRNAYRAELDTIALAATKANIMISLNGFIISALMISGAFIFASSPAFLLPAGVFLCTAATSIIFALLAASPEQFDLFGSLWTWVRDVRRGEARLRDLRQYVIRGSEAETGDDLNMLIYADRVRVNRAEYWQRMETLMRDRDNVYHKMSDQLYWLGLMANRKFKLLNISYTVFRWGLLLSLLSFIGVRSAQGLFPSQNDDAVVQLHRLGISEFNDIYEPSAVQQLSDGRILVVEDEAARAISVMSIADDGTLIEDPAVDLKLIRGFSRKMNDLEGLSIDEQDFVYAVTSHARTDKGARRPAREQLLRFRIKGSNVGDISSFTALADALSAADDLKTAIRDQSGEDVDFKKVNIEGLAYFRQTKQLLLGLREPKAGDHSIIVPIENPAQVFEDQADPVFGAPILLDLLGGGIRALSFDPVLGAFLIVNEVKTPGAGRHSQLWTWSGEADVPPEPILLPDIINLNNVESIDSITVLGEPRLLLMSDEGNAKKNQPAKYLMLDYQQLSQ
ncbi:Pycsar system effector family protein [Roseovarius sp. 2305UL8-3]|uniref:Pycsar system effector family protein n=1 Tax=Roseovarius conchicola TaxID=3121636 RepID=UPI0035296B92